MSRHAAADPYTMSAEETAATYHTARTFVAASKWSKAQGTRAQRSTVAFACHSTAGNHQRDSLHLQLAHWVHVTTNKSKRKLRLKVSYESKCST